MPPVKKTPRERDRHFLREWRKFRRLPQGEVADRMEIDGSTLSRIETQKIPYDQDVLEKAALIYGCDVEDLLSIDPLKPDPPRLIYSQLKKASPEIQRQALRIVEALLKDGTNG